MEFDTPLVRTLRDHLLGLARPSLVPRDPNAPEHGESPEERAILERFEPFAELLYLLTRADGHVDEAEKRAVLGAFRALTGGRVSSGALARVEGRLEKRRLAEGTPARLEAACSTLSMNRDDAELALTLASAVALSDEVLAPDESDFLESLSGMLGVPERRFQALLSNAAKKSSPPPSS